MKKKRELIVLKIFKAVLFLMCYINFNTYGQSILFGLTPNVRGGAGKLFALDRNGKSLTSKYDFGITDGSRRGNVVQAVDGKLYGVSLFGGENSSSGTIYEYDLLLNKYKIRHTFNFDDGNNPMSLILANGKLYGTIPFGGAFDNGVLFEFDPTTDTFIKRVDFGTPELGSFPFGELIQALNGKLYGTTDYGTIFEYDPVSAMTTVVGLLDVNSAQAGLVELNSKLYGMSSADSALLNLGYLYDFDLTTKTIIKRFNFTTLTGYNPLGNLIKASNGKLYGLMSVGGLDDGGTLFEYDPSTNIFEKKADFNSSITGINPQNRLMQASNGKLYGTTSEGGLYNKGTLFEYNITTNIIVKKLEFDTKNGSSPWGHLTEAANGKLYGMTNLGGEIPLVNAGVLFEYDPILNSQSIIWNFDYASQGSYPQGSVVYGTDSIFYGLTYRGGAIDKGALFSFNPKTETYSKKADFNHTITGANPYCSLIQAVDGKFYGTASNGGLNDQGTLFSFDAGTNILEKKHDFITSEGINPYGSLIQAPDGLLYGLTTKGGAGYGTLFSYNTTTSGYLNKKNLDSLTDGGHPFGSLVLFPNNGKLYGLTSSGGANGKGTVFSYDYGSNTLANVKNLDVTSGTNPTGSLVLANDGLLYGLTSSGGTNSLGTLFSFNPTGNIISTKRNLTTQTGYGPMGSLRLTSNGKLYGMTNKGGDNNLGTVFEYDPTTDTFTKTVDFNGTNGASPTYGNLVEICLNPVITLQPQSIITCIGSAFQLNITATGGPSYQWYANNQSILGANQNILTIAGATLLNTYYCRVTNECGTITSLVVTVTGNAIPTITGSALPNQVCKGYAVTISGSGAPLITVSGGIALGIGFIPTVSGTYTITGKDANQCLSNTLVNVTVTSLPVLSISGENSICPGTYSNLSISGANTYSWSNGSTAAGISVNPLSNTNYSVTGTDVNGCQAFASQLVSVTSIVNIPIAGDLSICKGDSTALMALNVSSVSWFNNATTTSIALLPLIDNKIFSVTGITPQGCIGEGAVAIRVHNLPVVTISGKTDICVGTIIPLSVSGAVNYVWSNQSTENRIDVTPKVTETFSVTGIDVNGCEASSSHTIDVHNLSEVTLDLSAINNTCDTLSPITLTGGSPTPGIYWNNNKTILGLNTSIAGDYLITYQYKDQNGCVNTASGILTSIHCTVPGICERPIVPCYCTNTCPPRFKIYSGVTPNGDAHNDTWIIDSLYTPNKITIIDKWGNEMYHTEDYQQDWDGKDNNGKQLPMGVYYYIIEIGPDKKRIPGTVSVIR